jgi:hypothetical protein
MNSCFLKLSEAVSKARHSALDTESSKKCSMTVMGLRVKPAMTLAHLTLLRQPLSPALLQPINAYDNAYYEEFQMICQSCIGVHPAMAVVKKQ